MYPDWVLRHKKKGTNISCINGRYYLYAASSVWNKNKGRAQKITNQYLGRITEDGLMPSMKGAIKVEDPKQMFKILLLQQWYGMSNQETEYAMLDRISFIRFVGFSLEEVPDHTTICRFRNTLVEKNLLQSLLDEINNQMKRQGKLVKKGVAVDAAVSCFSVY